MDYWFFLTYGLSEKDYAILLYIFFLHFIWNWLKIRVGKDEGHVQYNMIKGREEGWRGRDELAKQR